MTGNQSPSFSGRCFTWLTWGGIAACMVFQILYARNYSYFIADDYDHFIHAATLPLLQVITAPIDIHYVPLHKLFSVLVTKIAPLNFDVALAVLMAFHVLAVGVLYKLLQTLSPSRMNILIVLLYAGCPLILDPLMWWSSGIHRFPYIFLSLACLYAYVLYRGSRQWYYLVGCLLAYILALGFYSKALLIPLYVIGLELCLSPRSDLRRLLKRLIIGYCMLALSVCYLLWYVNFSPVMQQELNPEFSTGLEIVLFNFKVLVGVLTLHRYEAGTLFNVAVFVLLLFVVVASVRRKPRALLVWVVLLVCIGVNFAMVAFSGRGQAYGVFIAYALRYYFEIVFIVALFSGVLLGTLYSSSSVELHVGHWLVLAACMIYVALGCWASSVYRTGIYENSHLASARYMHRLLADLDHLATEGPIRVAHGSLPGYVYGAFINASMPIENVLPIRYQHLAFVPREQADYEIDSQGNLKKLPWAR